jgi:CBS domain containing-hemolysin-like protein
MSNLLLGIIFLALATLGVVMKKTYYFIPAKELKRRAEAQDKIAVSFYRAVAYGSSLRVMLWLYIALTAGAGLVLVAKSFSLFIGLIIVALALYVIFSVLPTMSSSRLGILVTKSATPAVAWLLNYLHPVLDRLSGKVNSFYFANPSTGIYDSSDLMDLLHRQQHQPDSRLSQEEIEIIKRAIAFSDKKVADVLIPRKQIKSILASDTIGPILIDELHKIQQSHVLVKESPKGKVVGSLAFNDLSINSKGHVSDMMNKTVYYLNQDDSLSEALHAFFTTNQAMFIVVNGFEEYVGVVTIEVIIKQLMGHIPGSDFESYTSLQAVASKHQTTNQPVIVQGESVKTDGEVVK